MWEAIASNRRRSLILISLMGVLLILLGAVIGGAINPSSGPVFGAAAAVIVWLIMWAAAAWSGDDILLMTAGAKEIQKEDAPQLWNAVEEMVIASGLPRMPRVYVIDDPSPNAFAVGTRPETAAVAATSGLLKRLNRDELQGVIAHEIGHVRNLDVRFMTYASVMVGAIVLLADLFLRGLRGGIGGGRRSSGKDSGSAQAIFIVLALVMALLAPLAAQLLYAACSRRREFLADASSARFTRYPPGLAAALEKISSQAGAAEHTQKVIAPLYIVNPLQDRGAFSLFSTHPPTGERVKILRGMSGAGLADYEQAFRQAYGEKKHCVGERTLSEADTATVRAATPEPEPEDDAIDRAKAVGKLLERVSGLVAIPCACGARLKVPPDFDRDTIVCPRCGRQNAIPSARPADPSASDAGGEPVTHYQRKSADWESFRCACGGTVQISPTFSAEQITCPRCKRTIAIDPTPAT